MLRVGRTCHAPVACAAPGWGFGGGRKPARQCPIMVIMQSRARSVSPGKHRFQRQRTVTVHKPARPRLDIHHTALVNNRLQTLRSPLPNPETPRCRRETKAPRQGRLADPLPPHGEPALPGQAFPAPAGPQQVERPNPETYGSPKAGGQGRPAYSASLLGSVVTSTRPLIAGSSSVFAPGRPSMPPGRCWNSPAGRRPLGRAS